MIDAALVRVPPSHLLPCVPSMSADDWRRAFQALARAGVSLDDLSKSFRSTGAALTEFYRAVDQAEKPQP